VSNTTVSPEAPAPVRPRGRARVQQTFTALKYRNYRLWFFGQMISLFGTWMQTTAQGYLVFQLTQSPAYLGYVGFASGVPSWLFMLYGGVVADRAPRRTLLILTQTSMMVLAFILAALTAAQIVQAWHIIVLAFLLGTANAFDAPARLAFVNELVEREDMTNAIALNATMFNTATAIGPAVAGVTYALVGPAWCFTINGLSFIAVIAALSMMKIAAQSRSARPASTRSDLKEGIRYTVTEPTIRTIIGLVGMVSLFGISFITLVPAWAVKVLGGDATTNGLLQAARGVGALIGALFLASLGRFRFKGRLLTIGTLTFPLLLIVFTTIRWTPLALLILVGVGAAFVLMMNLSNALVQTLVPDVLRGRVMSVYSLTFFGLMPIGSLWAGALAERIGEPSIVALGASIMLGLAALLWVFVPKVRALQ